MRAERDELPGAAVLASLAAPLSEAGVGIFANTPPFWTWMGCVRAIAPRFVGMAHMDSRDVPDPERVEMDPPVSLRTTPFTIPVVPALFGTVSVPWLTRPRVLVEAFRVPA